MGMSNGAAGMLGALGLAALAGGLAYGAHMVLPAGETDEGPGSTSSIAMSDDFCTLMEELAAYADALNAQDPSTDLMMDESAAADPATLTALHDYGQAMLDEMGPVAGFYGHAADVVTDPVVAASFETLATVTPALMEFMGRAALDAESAEDYIAALFGSFGDAELLALMGDGEAADLVVKEYVVETCGRDILGEGSGSGSETDVEFDFESGTDASPGWETLTGQDAAEANASWLGDLMEGYYSDWEEGDPQAEFVASGGGYEFDGGFAGWSDDGTEITGQYANGPDDWCVEVTSVDDPEWPWTYSAQSGLAQGTCS